ncbi:MAG: ABC transporter ATP-binding protein [Deltaproteobacteria bacterium]|nr:ABC transporter ATP-binding protein [Deltaproteobacteria bacterium]
MIQLINLSKSYKSLRAVDGINLGVKQGARFGFLGPNGAGKTTTIKMMAGVLMPSAGRIIINGHDLAKDPVAAKQCVGFIPDRPFLYEKLTGLEFLHFVAGLYGLNHNGELNHRINELLDLFGLGRWGEELIEGYSHGMKQRLVMCGALVHGPKVLIVDEPMVGLDPRGARLVKNIFNTLVDNGVTLFMATHSLDVAQESGDEIAIIQGGKLIAQGTGESLRRQAGVDGNLEEAFLRLTEEKEDLHGSSDPSVAPRLSGV